MGMLCIAAIRRNPNMGRSTPSPFCREPTHNIDSSTQHKADKVTVQAQWNAPDLGDLHVPLVRVHSGMKLRNFIGSLNEDK
jgi:hypothetical protein